MTGKEHYAYSDIYNVHKLYTLDTCIDEVSGSRQIKNNIQLC